MKYVATCNRNICQYGNINNNRCACKGRPIDSLKNVRIQIIILADCLFVEANMFPAKIEMLLNQIVLLTIQS